MTPEQQALYNFLSKPAPALNACGCMGPQLLPGETTTGADGYTDLALYATAKRYPVCPCAMQFVEEVEGRYYAIEEHRAGGRIEHIVTDLGPVGGPYR